LASGGCGSWNDFVVRAGIGWEKSGGCRLKTLDFLKNPNLTASAFDAMLSEFNQKMSADGVVRTAHLITHNWAMYRWGGLPRDRMQRTPQQRATSLLTSSSIPAGQLPI